MNEHTSSKLSPHFVWLFAIAAVVVGLAASIAATRLGFSDKFTAGAYCGVVLGCGFLSTFLTRARIRGALLAFTTAAAGAAAAYFFLISKLFGVASAAVETGGTAVDLAAAQSVQSAGNAVGGFIAVVVFLATFVPSIIGILVGSKSRGSSVATAAGNLVKAAG